MELHKIERLAEKYLEGKTTLEEEKQLREYFTSENVPEHLGEYKILFGFFKNEQTRTYRPEVRNRRWKKQYNWFAVAASIAIIAGLFLFKPTPSQDLGTIKDPQVALQKTKEALNLIAQQMQNGKKHLTYLTAIDNTKDELIIENQN